MVSTTATPEYRDLPQAHRDPEHPILEPRQDAQYWWETLGTFNPGVTEYNGKVILLYRAYDQFRISRFGLADSTDGIKFQTYDLPAVDTDPNDPYERLGIEDARITKIDDTYYILHTSASYHSVQQTSDVHGVMEHLPWRVRVGMRTTKDFKTFEKHGIILPDTPAKNACLLPEKIDGAFAVLYRQHQHHPDEGEILKLAFTHDFVTWHDTHTGIWPKPEKWQQGKFGLGSPPITTPHGFLMVYHAVDAQGAYRLGLMMLDRQDPCHIIWFSDPILEPTMSYEKEGFVPNVVYCCGALLRNQDLWIYYGAADRVTARAVLSLKDIL